MMLSRNSVSSRRVAFACAACVLGIAPLSRAQFSQMRFPGEIVSTRTLPLAVAAGDLNGDGIVDIVAAHDASGGASTVIASGRADGTFAVTASLAGPAQPTRVLVQRLNPDPFPDVIVVGNTRAFVYLTNATGQFTSSITAGTLATTNVLSGGLLADFDHDGIDDLVTATTNTSVNGGIMLCRGQSTGTFGASQATTLLKPTHAVVALDFNADGFLDVVATNPTTHKITAILNTQGFGLLPTADFPAGTEPWDVAAIDHDGDGVLDVVVTDRSASRLVVLPGQPNGLPGQPSAFFGAPISIDIPSPAQDVVVADANGDGRLDVITTLPEFGAVLTRLNDGAGGFSDRLAKGIGYVPRALATLDANRDGNLDVVTTNWSNSNLTLLCGDGTGALAVPSRTPMSAGVKSVAFGDVDLDGKVDAVVAEPAISIYRGDGTGRLAAGVPINQTQSISKVYVAQLDDTPAPELVTLTSFSATLRVLVRRGPNTYAVASTISTPPQPFNAQFADLDADGDLDVLVGCGSPATSVALFFGDGAGGFSAGPLLPSAPNASAVVARDFDGDLDLDLAICGGTSPVQIFTGDGTGAFTFSSTIANSAPVTDFVGADVDEDGNVDLVAVEQFVGRVTIWRGDGAAGFTLASAWPFGAPLRAIAAEDLDHDGHVDFVVGGASGLAVVLRGDGHGAYSLVRAHFGGTVMSSLALADFDGDSFADIGVLDTGMSWLSLHVQGRYFRDCNTNGFDDLFDVQTGSAGDCDSDRVLDVCEITLGAPDCDANGRPDACDVDSDSNGVVDACEAVAGTPYCFGDGSAAPCPCNNASAASDHAGCRNVTGSGAQLTATGFASLAADTVVFHLAGVTPSGAILYFQGTLAENGGLGTPFGDGVRCVTGSVVRLATRTASGGLSDWPRSGDEHVSVRGNVPPVGGTRYYSALYRDGSAFCSPSNFNYANGVELQWTP